jgi:hypothetical protein
VWERAYPVVFTFIPGLKSEVFPFTYDKTIEI